MKGQNWILGALVLCGLSSCKTRTLSSLSSDAGRDLPPAAISVLYPHPSDIRFLQGGRGKPFFGAYVNFALDIHRELVPRFCGGLWPRLVRSETSHIDDKRFEGEPSLPEEAREILGQNCGDETFALISQSDFDQIVDLADGKLEPDGQIPSLFRFSFERVGRMGPGTRHREALDMAASWRWHVVAFRYAPCAFYQGNGRQCIPEIRVVAQPILAYGPVEFSVGARLPDSATGLVSKDAEGAPAFADYGIHLFYRLTHEENEAVRRGILNAHELSKEKGCEPPKSALMAHSCLTREMMAGSDYSFSRHMREILGSLATPFYKTAVMVSRQNNVAWKFYALKRDKDGQLVRDLIPALDPASAQGLGPKAAVSKRMEQVFSRGISTAGASSHGAHHVRANPRPKATLDSLDLFIRTFRKFQSEADYLGFFDTRRRALERYLQSLGIEQSLTQEEKDALLVSHAQLKGGKDGPPAWIAKIPDQFQESSAFKMALFWSEIERDALPYREFRERLGIDASEDKGLTTGCFDASCAFAKLLGARSGNSEELERLKEFTKQAQKNFDKSVMTDDIRGLSQIPVSTLSSREAALGAVKERIDDPGINSEFTVDCVSCHVSYFESYESDDDPLATMPIDESEMASNGMYMTNQFSYYRDVPIVSRRVQYETIEQLKKF